MRLQYFSDIHLEFFRNFNTSRLDRFITIKAPILVLCGDIGDPDSKLYVDVLRYLSIRFDKIFLLTGNHEFYNKTVQYTNQKVLDICKSFQNISYMQNSYEDYDGYRFAGTTFWSRVSDPKHLTNDFYRIRDFSMDTCNRLHDESRRFVSETLQGSPLPIIMMTHHMPSHRFTDPIYFRHHEYQQCFSSPCDDLIRDPIRLWIYGHTHRPYEGEFYHVQIRCNPIGYPGENTDTNFNKIIDITQHCKENTSIFRCSS